MSQEPLTLGISDPSDDESERKLVISLESLINGVEDAESVSRAVDNIITSECQEAYTAYTSAEGQQAEENRTSKPNPADWQHYLWRSLGKAAMAIPSDHPGQDRLVRLLQELKRLPLHNVPWLTHEGLMEKQLWVLNHGNSYEYFDQSMWELDQGNFTGGRQIESDPLIADRYMNFSAFLARLFASGVVDTTRLSALVKPEFLGVRWPYNKEAEHSQPYVIAAAQWIIYSGTAFHEVCEKEAFAARAFNMSWWIRWKARFTQVADANSGFSVKARQLAVEALKLMMQTEKQEHIALSVIQEFSLNVKEADEDDEVDGVDDDGQG